MLTGSRSTAPLGVRPFGRLLTGYTVNTAGDRVGVVALALLVYAQTRDPLATMALFLAAEFVPAFVAPALTARIDQRSLRRTLPALYLLEAAAFAALAFVADGRFSLALVLVLAFADGALALTARGLLRSGLNAVLAPAGLLRRGNALINVGFAVATVGGAALGGVLVDGIGVSSALLVNACSFVLIAALLASSSGLPEAAGRPASSRGRVKEGLAWVRAHRIPRLLFAGEALALICFTLIVPIEVVYAAETLDTDEAGYGVLLASWGAGVVLGSAVYLRLTTQPAARLILGSTLAIGLAYTGMGATTALAVACALSVVGGMGNGMQWVSVMTRLQEETPGALQARVTGLLEAVASGMTGVGFLVGGVITALFAPETAFTIAGLTLVLLVAVAAVALRPRRRPAAP